MSYSVRIFQNESFFTTFPSRNTQRSQASYVDPLPGCRRARQGPLGRAAIAIDEVLVILVADIRYSREPTRKCLADRIAADKPLAVPLRPPRRVEDGVIGEVGHDRLEVMLIECVRDLAEHRQRVIVFHTSSYPGRARSGSCSDPLQSGQGIDHLGDDAGHLREGQVEPDGCGLRQHRAVGAAVPGSVRKSVRTRTSGFFP
jgi:hypothetical protein